MDIDKVFKKTEFCHSCYNFQESQTLQKWSLKYSPLLSLFQDHDVTLCFSCNKQAEYFESFAQNVAQTQQLFLGVDTIDTLTLQATKALIARPTKTLTVQALQSIHIGSDQDPSASISEETYVVFSCSKQNKALDVKLEVKQEGLADDFDDGFLDEDDLALSFHSLKDEDAIKEEVIEDTNKNMKKKSTKKKIKKEKKEKSKLKTSHVTETRHDTDYCELVHITRDECMREREQQAQSEKYLRQPYKCTDCIKGYQYKAIYDTHMEMHNKNYGEFVCDICNQRRDSCEKLKYHAQYHKVRYRCRECGVSRAARRSVLEHYVTAHASADHRQYTCHTCGKSYKRPFTLRKHISYVHGQARVTCDYCQKSYCNKEVLRKHIIEIHIKDDLPAKTHVCLECGKSFRAPSLLKKHLLKHTNRKDFYCVECDKSFKSNTGLKHHLKTATPHVKNGDLHYPCPLCDKRCSNRRDLDNHVNSLHLKVKPYQCDKCDKSYVSKWSLKDHKRLTHDGYKRPLAYPCPMCDKVFDRNQIRKAHIRTHTGERPYACAACPAAFAQSSVLRTHYKLIHLRVTRDGRAKGHGIK